MRRCLATCGSLRSAREKFAVVSLSLLFFFIHFYLSRTTILSDCLILRYILFSVLETVVPASKFIVNKRTPPLSTFFFTTSIVWRIKSSGISTLRSSSPIFKYFINASIVSGSKTTPRIFTSWNLDQFSCPILIVNCAKSRIKSNNNRKE